MSYELIVKPDAAAVAQVAAQQVVQQAQAAVAQRGRFRMALAGGGTPAALYRLLAAKPYRPQMPWPQTHVFWGDERFLPPGDPGRNDTAVLPLLAQVALPTANVHPVPYVAGDPAAAAQRYEALLRAEIESGAPPLDLVLLGLGHDGHTASLFPGTPALEETSRLVVPNNAAYEDRHPQRVTLTFAAINAAALVIFLVTGADKRTMLQQVLDSPASPPLPAQRVRPAAGRLLWLVDRAATGAWRPS